MIMLGNVVLFTDRRGEKRAGRVVREYGAFEGGIRYIIVDETNGREYRCVNVNDELVELVV